MPMAGGLVHERDVSDGVDAFSSSSLPPTATTPGASGPSGPAMAAGVSDASRASTKPSASSTPEQFFLAAKLIEDESKSDVFNQTEYLSCQSPADVCRARASQKPN